jgi:PAS domain S-box-containing protein
LSQRNIYLLLLAAVILLFLSDIFMPVGMAVGFGYIIVILISSRLLSTRKTIFISFLSSLLVIADIFFTEGYISTYFLFNRVLAVILLWLVTYFLLRTKKIENDLRVSEFHYRSIVEGTNEGIIIRDKNDFILFVNSRMLNMLGHPENEFIGKKFTDFITGPVETDLAISGEYELKINKKNGSAIITAVTVTPLNTSENINEQLIVVKDITSRKKIEEALKESQERLSGIVSSAMDAIITVNSKQEIILFNKAAEKLFGYTAGEILGKHLDTLIPHDIRDMHKLHVKSFGETGTTNRHMGALGAVRGLKNNGEEFPIEASISQIFSSNEKLYTVILRDITEREKNRQQLLESENRFRNMADNAPVFIWLTDGSNEFTFFNKTWLKFTGRNMEEEINWKWSTNVHPDERETVLKTFRENMAERKSFSNVFRLARADGIYRWILNNGEPRYTDREFSGFIGSCVDITERMIIEEQLNISLKEKKILIKEVHHRVKNNLQIVSSLLSLQSGLIKDPVIQDLMIESQNRIKSMALIHEKLYQSEELSKVDVRMYLTELINNLISSYLPENNNVKLQIEIDEIEINLDSGISIGLIINELISNIIKYAFPAGFKGEKKIDIILKKEDSGKLKLIIKDNGIGIKKGFNIAESSSLGLQLVYGFVQQLDGSIEFYNKNGTTVEMNFNLSSSLPGPEQKN